MDKGISRKITLFQFVFTLGIVFFHGRSTYPELLNSSVSQNLIYKCYMNLSGIFDVLSLSFFFFMSSYLFGIGIKNYKDAFKKVLKRFKSLVIPFILWNIITFIYFSIKNTAVLNLAFFKNLFFYDPMAGPLWYLLALFIMVAFISYHLVFKENKWITSFIYLLLFIFFVFIRGKVFPIALIPNENWWWYGNLFYYFPVFLVGSYIGLYFPNLIDKFKYEKRIYTIIGVLLLVIGYVLPLDRRINSMIMIVGLWFFIKPKWLKKDNLLLFGTSFYIFAMHQQLILPNYYKIIKFIWNGYTFNGYEIVFIKLMELAVVIVASLIVKYIFKFIFSEKFNNYLTGGRN